jgi:hypothetical protein
MVDSKYSRFLMKEDLQLWKRVKYSSPPRNSPPTYSHPRRYLRIRLASIRAGKLKGGAKWEEVEV